LISRAEKELRELDSKRNELIKRIKGLKESLPNQLPPTQKATKQKNPFGLSVLKESIMPAEA